MRIVVTGANRGIGAELVSQYRARGDEVIGTSRQAIDGLEPLDVTSTASVSQFAESMAGKPLDLLICNAGVYLDKGMTSLEAYSPEIWANTFAANVTGVFLTIRAMEPLLAGSVHPKIAIISSIMASSSRAPGGAYAYRASKAAVSNLGSNLAKDFRGAGIAVGIYHPGWVRTDMGGAEADIDVAPAVRGLIDRFDELSLHNTGRFLSYDGTEIPF